jgi:hypothetical protein
MLKPKVNHPEHPTKGMFALLSAAKKKGITAPIIRPDPLKIAYLLRGDLQKRFRAQDPILEQTASTELRSWWQDQGCFEYLAWMPTELQQRNDKRTLKPL